MITQKQIVEILTKEYAGGDVKSVKYDSIVADQILALIFQDRKGKVKIDSQGKDEAYCEWFQCSDCGNTMITSESNFCPNCGKKILKSKQQKAKS